MKHDSHVPPALTRRDVLVRAAHGFGSLALASMLPGAEFCLARFHRNEFPYVP